MKWMLVFISVMVLGCTSAKPPFDEAQGKQAAADGWVSLFDGKTLGNWAPTQFAGHGEVRIEDGAIVLTMGSSMTGVTWQGEPPARSNYEVELDAMRTLGNDFFCGLTFPVGDDPCTLILAGWGGAVVGLSNLNGSDASQNETTTFYKFENDHWYHVRLRVEPDRIQAWIGEERIINVDITDKGLTIRPEVELSKPLGIATWNTEGRIKNIRWRMVKP